MDHTGSSAIVQNHIGSCAMRNFFFQYHGYVVHAGDMFEGTCPCCTLECPVCWDESLQHVLAVIFPTGCKPHSLDLFFCHMLTESQELHKDEDMAMWQRLSQEGRWQDGSIVDREQSEYPLDKVMRLSMQNRAKVERPVTPPKAPPLGTPPRAQPVTPPEAFEAFQAEKRKKEAKPPEDPKDEIPLEEIGALTNQLFPLHE